MKQEIKSENTKKKIREVALELFNEKGYKETSVKEICQISNYSVGAFYHQFQSKADILDDAYSEFDDYLINFTSKKNYLTATEAILDIIYEQSKQISENKPEIVSALFREQLSFGKKYIVNKKRFELQELIRFIEEGIQSKEFKSNTDSKKIALAIFRVSIGDIYVWCLEGGQFNLVKEVLYDTKLIINNIRL